MIELFEIQNQKAFPITETLLISPFKEIWERDKSTEKEIAIKELSYIEFMTSEKPSNPFKGYTEDQKEEKIISNLFKNKKWKPDKLVKSAVQDLISYQEEGSATYRLYIASKEAIQSLTEFFISPDILKQTNDRGVPIYKPADITRALKDVEEVSLKFENLGKKLKEGLKNIKTKVRSDKKISFFADKDSFEKNV